MEQRLTLLVLLVASVAGSAGGQTPDTAAKRQAAPASDSVFIRARQLVVDGNGPAGRALIDSVIAATPDTSASYPNALYWRASLAATAADAERDYRRIIVDFPMSPRSGDALLAVAQLEIARGDRTTAEEHLQRFLLEDPQHPDRWRAGLTLGRVLLDDGKTPRGCAVLARTRSAMPADAVELRNQLDYYAQRCVGVDTTDVAAAAPAPPVRADSSKASAAAKRDSSKAAVGIDSAKAPAKNDSAKAPAKNDSVRTPAKADSATTKAKPDSARAHRPAPAKPADTSAKRAAPPDSAAAVKNRALAARTGAAAAQYSIQVAAYATKLQAERLAATLRKRGLSARTVGATKPFRVRVGRYGTKAAAADAERSLRKMGITGFVTAAEPEKR